jgi:hypothetical protein
MDSGNCSIVSTIYLKNVHPFQQHICIFLYIGRNLATHTPTHTQDQVCTESSEWKFEITSPNQILELIFIYPSSKYKLTKYVVWTKFLLVLGRRTGAHREDCINYAAVPWIHLITIYDLSFIDKWSMVFLDRYYCKEDR